jgi:hypothetical protein
LRKSGGGLLVLVFEKKRLIQAASLQHAFLAGQGYPRSAPLFVLLDYLSKRCIRDDFPHEIGIFLGYPVEDVRGFVAHKGRNYKLCGYWKVYGDVEKAKKCFRRYDACREYCRALLPDPGQTQWPITGALRFLDGTKGPEYCLRGAEQERRPRAGGLS